MKFFYSLFFMLIAFGSMGQSQKMIDNCVKIQASYKDQLEDEAFGFITEYYGDSIYVATAGHILDLYPLLKDSLTVTIYFTDSSKSKARILYFSPKVSTGRLDVAILKTKRPNTNLFKNYRWGNVFTKVRVYDQVLFLGNHEDWRVLDTLGTISEFVPPLEFEIEAEKKKRIARGSLGGPAFVNGKIGGMIIRAKSSGYIAHSIDTILNLSDYAVATEALKLKDETLYSKTGDYFKRSGKSARTLRLALNLTTTVFTGNTGSRNSLGSAELGFGIKHNNRLASFGSLGYNHVKLNSNGIDFDTKICSISYLGQISLYPFNVSDYFWKRPPLNPLGYFGLSADYLVKNSINSNNSGTYANDLTGAIIYGLGINYKFSKRFDFSFDGLYKQFFKEIFQKEPTKAKSLFTMAITVNYYFVSHKTRTRSH